MYLSPSLFLCTYSTFLQLNVALKGWGLLNVLHYSVIRNHLLESCVLGLKETIKTQSLLLRNFEERNNKGLSLIVFVEKGTGYNRWFNRDSGLQDRQERDSR